MSPKPTVAPEGNPPSLEAPDSSVVAKALEADDVQARIDRAVAEAMRSLQVRAGNGNLIIDVSSARPAGPYKAPVPTDAQLEDPAFVSTHCTGGRPGCGSTRDRFSIRDDGLDRDKPWKCKPCRQGHYREDGTGPLQVIPPPNLEAGIGSPSREAYDAWLKNPNRSYS